MNKPTILLVSSDEVVQDRFTPALACLGYRVQNIHIGDEALLQLLQGGACLMVTELYVSSVAGDCLTQAVKDFSDTAHVPVIRLVETTISVNDERIAKLVDKVATEYDGDLSGKTVAVLGIAFKPNTDDIREAASLTLIPALQEAGAIIRAHDPEAMTAAKDVLENVVWCDDAYEACDGADIVVILTEWNEYRGLDLTRIAASMCGRILIDFRNVYRLSEMRNYPLRYVSVGRPAVEGPA